MDLARTLLLFVFVAHLQHADAAPRRYGHDNEIALQETRDSLDSVRHGVENLETELQMFQERVNNQEETINSMRNQLQETTQSTKEFLKGNSSIWDHKLNALETANKSLIADFTQLKTHANETAKALENFEKRIRELERQAAVQSKNVDNLQTALRALTEALQVKEGFSAAGKFYRVRAGDSLEKIAKANNTTVKAIKELNHISEDNDRIVVGQEIQLP